MSCWYRVFGAAERQPSPARILEPLRVMDVTGPALFRGDNEGWTAVEIVVEEGTTLLLECYLASEKGIRADLNAWAAEVETREDCPRRLWLMERIIQTKQWYTMECPTGWEYMGESISRLMARETEGIYQVDGVGFFDRDGGILLKE